MSVSAALLSPPVAFLGVGDTEMLLIMVVVLIFFGGQKMPDFARGLGKTLRELKKASSEVEREFKRVLDEAENPPARAPLIKPPDRPTVPATAQSWPAVSAEASPASGAAPLPPPAPPAAAPAPLPPPAAPPPAQGSEYHSDI